MEDVSKSGDRPASTDDEIEITPAMIEAGVRFAKNTLMDLSVGDSTIRYLVEGVLGPVDIHRNAIMELAK